MVSKFTRIVTSVAFFSVMALNSNLHAVGSDNMEFGIIGGYQFNIYKNKNLNYTVGAAVPVGSGLTAAGNFGLDAKTDNGFGVFGLVGYGMSNGALVGLEAGYQNIKIKDSYNASKLEAKNFLAYLSGTYRMDFCAPVLPFITAGIGAAYVDLNGNIYNTDKTIASANPATADSSISFDSLKRFALAYKIGAGLAFTPMENFSFGVSYTLRGIMDLKDNKDYTDLVVKDVLGGKFTNVKDYTFGKIQLITHNVEAMATFTL